MKNPNTHKGAALLILLFSTFFLVIIGRFLYIQATAEVEGVNLEEWAEDVRTSSYVIDAKRGKIYDRNGMVLAYDRPMYRIYAIVDPAYSTNLEEPKHVTNPEKAASVLAPLLDMEVGKIESIIEEGQDEERFQVEFGPKGRNLTQQEMEAIKAKDLNGIQFKKEAKRYYPNGQFASRIIGFARTEGGNIKGVTGIEKQMEKYLKEEKGRIKYQRDKFGTKLLDPNQVLTEPDHGENVYLTIDQKIQTFLEDAMSQVYEQYSPEKIMAAVMDPETGAILAMSNRPSYNPNDINGINNWYNDIISYPFEVGSTMKIFTWAAAMEEGVYNGDEMYKSGTYRVTEESELIGDYNNDKGWGMITFDQGFQHSSNVAAAKLVWEHLGPTKFRNYLTKFNLDRKTGIDLPGERTGSIVYEKPIEIVTTSFGQGSTFTAIQLMTAATSVANDGKMMRPYVISKVKDSETGEVLKGKEPEVIGTPISPDTAEQMRQLMGTVVTSEDGTGQSFKLQDYSLAGKTGTAQLLGPNGDYLTGRENYVFSFMGMAPVDDPELLIYVAVQQPELEPTEIGSEPVSYIVRTVMENSLHYLDVKPDHDTKKTIEQFSLPDVTDLSVQEAKDRLKENFDRVEVVGDGSEVVQTLPAPNTKVVSNQHILLITDQPKMPDLTGYALRDVHRLAQYFDLKMEVMGNGYVTKQSIKPGAKIKEGDYLVVELAPPNPG